MRRVLIVDDKALIRRGLIKMIQWERLGIEFAGEAQDMPDALSRIEELHPDIVITDIRMRGEDGLALLRRLRERYSHIRTLVVSGYDDFSYVQQAVRSGSVDYLLKPVDPGELNRSLEKACRSLREELRQGGQTEKALLVFQALRSRSADGGQPAELDEMFAGGATATAVIARRENTETDPLAFHRRFAQRWGDRGIVHLAENEESMYLLVNTLPMPREAWEKRIHGDATSCLRGTPGDSGRFTVGIGDTVGRPQDAPRSFTGALTALAFCMLNPMVHLATAHDVVQYGKQGTFAFKLGRFRTAVGSGNLQESQSELAQLVNGLTRQPPIVPAGLRALGLKLVASVLAEEQSLIAEAQELLRRLEDDESLLGFRSLEAVMEALNAFVRLAVLRCLERLDQAGSLPERIRQFVQENYADEINLESIARLFCISPAHASTTFHKICGETISRCIARTRVDRAKSFLTSSPWGVCEIAQRVGYADPDYFHKVFKRIAGETPGQYRARLAGKPQRADGSPGTPGPS